MVKKLEWATVKYDGGVDWGSPSSAVNEWSWIE